MAPRFVSEGWLDYSGEEWKLKEGAPPDIVAEFDEYMKSKRDDKINGVIVDY